MDKIKRLRLMDVLDAIADGSQRVPGLDEDGEDETLYYTALDRFAARARESEKRQAKRRKFLRNPGG